MATCFSCHKKIGILSQSRSKQFFINLGFLYPDEMIGNDKLCMCCSDEITNNQIQNPLFKTVSIQEETIAEYPFKRLSFIPKKVKSTKSIKLNYYFNVFFIIFSPIWILFGLLTENLVGWTLGIIMLIISIIQHSSKKKEYHKIAKN